MCELRRVARILGALLPGRALKRIVQADASSLVLTFAGSNKNKIGILASCDSEYARICAALETQVQVPSTGTFYEYARAHLTGAVLTGVEISRENRQIGFSLDSRPDSWVLYLSILGGRSNIYLVDARGLLVHSMRPLDETRRDLKIGEAWMHPPGSVPSEGEDRWKDIPDDIFLETVGTFYGSLGLRRDAQTLVRKVSQVLNKERTLLGRKLDRLHEDLAGARLAETYRENGELLKSVLHAIKPGDDRITATDYKTGENVEISLDPTLSPAANLEAYFTRYQKDSRGAKMIGQQLERLEALRDDLDGIEGRMDSAFKHEPPDMQTLEDIASQPVVRRLIGRYAPKQRKEPSPAKSKFHNEIPARLRPKRYRTEDGLEIWVGRNDEGNDYLTTRLARGNDLFFHLEGYPGSHVVLRTEGRSDPPSGSILDACELAVHYSKMKNAGSADVHIAPIKNVKKPRGAKPGLVYVRQGKTIRLRRDPGRLQNILASRCDG
jgi:predicted ribosome quality control (RQC) complex YloA/Tae2 family protein